MFGNSSRSTLMYAKQAVEPTELHVLILPSWFNPSEPESVSPFIFEQAQALQRCGVEIGVLYVGYAGFSINYTQREIHGVRILSITLPRILRRLRQVSLVILRVLSRILYKNYCRHYGEPMLLHGHSMYAGGICAAGISKRHDKPFVVTEHFSGFALGQFREWQLKSIRTAVRLSSKIFFVSEALQKDFCDIVQTINWKVIPNNYAGQLEEGIQPFISKSGRSYFCIVSRLDDNKNLALCLRAFSLLDGDHNDLVIVGSGPKRAELEQLASDLKISQRVLFLGARSRTDTFSLIKGALALIVSSNYETFGMTILEAGFLGTPVISTRCGGPVEIMSDKFGVLVNKGDPEEMARAMVRAESAKEEFKSVVATQTVREKYAPSEIAAQLRSEYIDALNKSHLSCQLHSNILRGY
jgi:teichuronic acid biosynthesis glycosyltransferase TuaC